MSVRSLALIGVVLVAYGYNLGRKRKSARSAATRPAAALPPARREWLSVKLLLGIVIVLLVLAILSSLQR